MARAALPKRQGVTRACERDLGVLEGIGPIASTRAEKIATASAEEGLRRDRDSQPLVAATVWVFLNPAAVVHAVPLRVGLCSAKVSVLGKRSRIKG